MTNNRITTLDAYQLASDFVSQVMITPAIEIQYLSTGWIPHLRRRLSALDSRLAIEEAWSPELQSQRLDDDSIMKVIAACTIITKKENRLANETRLWLRVICISWGRLTGKWQATSNSITKWPNQPTPSHEHWSVFCRCLWNTFCTSASPWQQSRYLLDQRIGKWFNRARHIHSFRSNNHRC